MDSNAASCRMAWLNWQCNIRSYSSFRGRMVSRGVNRTWRAATGANPRHQTHGFPTHPSKLPSHHCIPSINKTDIKTLHPLHPLHPLQRLKRPGPSFVDDHSAWNHVDVPDKALSSSADPTSFVAGLSLLAERCLSKTLSMAMPEGLPHTALQSVLSHCRALMSLEIRVSPSSLEHLSM